MKRVQKRSKRTYKKRPIRKKRPKRAMVKQIKKVVRRMAETKSIRLEAFDLEIRSVLSSQFQAGQMIYPLSLQPGSLLCHQGAGQSERIGNKITIVRNTWKGCIYPTIWDGTFNSFPRPIEVKLWIFVDKTMPTSLPLPAQDFFEDDNSVSGFTGTLPDLFLPVNKGKYNVLYSRIFKVGCANYQGTNNEPNRSYFANNDYKFNCKFSINLAKLQPRNVVFNDDSSSPLSRHTYAMFCPVYADGAILTGTQIPLAASWCQDLGFKDL